MTPSTQLKTGKLSFSFAEVSRFESHPHARLLLSLCHPKISLANNPNQKPASPDEDAVCRMHVRTWGLNGSGDGLQDACWHWFKFGSGYQEFLCRGFWGKMLLVSGKLLLQMRCRHPLQCCDRCQCWDPLAWCALIAQGPFFHCLCADTVEAECLGMHLPLASVSWGQCSDRHTNSDWSKLICAVAKAAGSQQSYSLFL